MLAGLSSLGGLGGGSSSASSGASLGNVTLTGGGNLGKYLPWVAGIGAVLFLVWLATRKGGK